MQFSYAQNFIIFKRPISILKKPNKQMKNPTTKWHSVYLSGFYFQLVNIESVPLQSTCSQWQKLLQSFNIFLDFKHCFWRHSTNFFLNLFLFLHKFPKKRKLSLKKNTSLGTSLVVQWLSLCAPTGLGSFPGQGTRSHMLPLRPGSVK